MACVLTSAGGIISLLDEKEPELQIYALQRLNDDSVIRQFWAEIADSLEPIEILYEDESFAARNNVVRIALAKLHIPPCPFPCSPAPAPCVAALCCRRGPLSHLRRLQVYQ